jgi:membrane protein DedA with SNARE-associated domain
MLLSTLTTIAALGLDPEKLINQYGLVGIAMIVFAETGLLVGFFLPGDSLLFTGGLLCATEVFDQPILLIVLVTMAAAVIGDQVGYRIGTKAGPALFDKPKSRLFNPEHVVKAQAFFDRHGPKAIVLARFVPIVRTFTPVIAGGLLARKAVSRSWQAHRTPVLGHYRDLGAADRFRVLEASARAGCWRATLNA